MSLNYRVRRALSPLVLPSTPTTVQEVESPRPTVQDYIEYLINDSPRPNYELDDSYIDEITYRIMTNIHLYKPKREIEISPVTRMRINI